jgi:pimeloyl-ACP methyl ester carboxylesterase
MTVKETSGAAILTEDRWLDHISTSPAIAGQPIKLFVRERQRDDRRGARDGKIVLMVHGGFWPCSLAFDFPSEDYSWMAALARAGWDVFAMDMTGYGKSIRPLMDDPRNLDPKQQPLLVPHALSAPAPAVNPYQLVTNDSESDDIDRVVDFIRALRGVDRIALLGWSGGGCRVGNYTARHPEKVKRLVIYASSNYGRNSSSEPPAKLPAPGFPVQMQTRGGMDNERWTPAISHERQVAPGIQDLSWKLCMESDPVGAAWGGLRGPTRTYWGWNASMAARLTQPALVMIGANDRLLPANRDLYADLGATTKSMVEIDHASHFAQWEMQRRVLHRLSLAWLENTTVGPEGLGQFRADEDGKLHAIG